MRIIVDKDVRVPLRDGTQLVADVYRPDGPARVPALVQRTPYGKDTAALTNLPIDVLRVVQAGFAAVVQDTRGRGGSEGAWTPFEDEADDGADTLAWVAAQAWCSGRVGTFGQSYVGATQWLAASRRPPALAATMPVITAATPHDGWMYHGGAFELGFALLWTLMFLAPPELLRRGADPADVGAVIAAADAAEHIYARTPLVDVPELGSAAPYYRDWLERPGEDAAWRRVAAGAVDVPALIVGGWYDLFLRGTLASFRGMRDRGGTPEARERTRLVLGPWAHGVDGGTFVERRFGLGAGLAALDPTAMLVEWSNEWLRGQPPASPRPRVLLFVMGPDVWREEEDWPLPDTAWTDFHLRADGVLSTEPPGEEGATSFVYDPRDPVPTVGGASFLPGVWLGANAGPRDQRPLDGRSDILRFSTRQLEAPLEVTGPVELVIHLSSTAVDTDVVGRLVDVAPDGRATLVTDGILRARYRHSAAAPEPLEPGHVHELRIDLSATSWVFAAGHRLRLDVTSSNFPRFDRNTNTGGTIAHERIEDAVTATNTVHHDRLHPSHVVLPVIARDG